MKIIIFLILIHCSFILYCQVDPEHPDLGLNGIVTWVDSTHIKIEYDWSDDSQLLDWVVTTNSALVRETGFVTITGDDNSIVQAMIWKQGIKCSRINAKDVAPLSPAGHLNFYSNLKSFNGSYLPNPGLGAVLSVSGNFWTHDGTNAGNIGAPFLVVGVARDYDYNVSTAGMTIKSSVNDVVYSYNTACVPVLERKIALGGWGGNTRWGKITIEGEVISPWQYDPLPSDVINIQSFGAMFAPVIEVVGTPAIEWIFADSTTNASTKPVKNYASEGSRHNYLKVTPWSALIGINVGYDASDGGYGGFAMVDNQYVLGFQNLALSKSSLQYLCANYSLITELDLTEFTALKFVELFDCHNLATLRLGSHPALERLCVENCILSSLDLSGCANLKEIRGGSNNFTSVNWGSIGQLMQHLCIGENPQIKTSLPSVTQFPSLRELSIGNTNQAGAFVCHSSVIQMIYSDKNNYTSADISGCTSLSAFYISGSQLASLNLGTATHLTNVRLDDCGLTESQIDYVLYTIDKADLSNGYLDLTGNASPSAEGLAHFDKLKKRGWTINFSLVPVTDIAVNGSGESSTITTDNGTLQLSAILLPANSTYKTVTWSIINGTGQATINASGLVKAIDNGIVTAVATAKDSSGVYGTLIITISNQLLSQDDLPFIIRNLIVTSNEIKVLLDDRFISWKAYLYNLQGKLLISQIVDSDVLIFDISNLPLGFYIVVLSQSEKIWVAKVIKP